MKKIIFIEPKAPNLHIFSRYPLPRLGPLILGAMMRDRGWKAEVIFEETRAVDFESLKSADLVGVSSITSTAPRAYAIADRIRETGVPVVMGGPHVTWLSEEALSHADFIIRGEGEKPLMALIDALEGNADLENVPNLSYRQNGRIVHNPMSPPVEDLDQIPPPDFSLLAESGRRAFRFHKLIPVQTSRGCPYDCSFCSVTGMFGRKYRFRSTENIMQELRHYNSSRNIIFFYDDNFAAERRRTRELLEAMIRERFRFRWTAQVRADVARDPDLVRLMKKAGCHTLYIGLESVNPESLKAMRKRQTLGEMVQFLRLLRRRRINVHGMFVYGFDQDDWQTVRQTVKFARKTRLNSTQFMILTPLPGSETFNRMSSENRILFHDWSLYDAHHAVFQPARLSLSALQKAQMFSHRKFYAASRQIGKIFRWKWFDVVVAGYARRLNRTWKKRNRAFLKTLDLLRSRQGIELSIDYRETVRLDK